jgi:hypothetical protein
MNRGVNRNYDLHPDGSVAMLKPGETSDPRDKAVSIFNFFDELRRVAR